MRVKLDHKPGKAEVVLRLSKEEAHLVENAFSEALNATQEPDQRLPKMAAELKKVLATYPAALA